MSSPTETPTDAPTSPPAPNTAQVEATLPVPPCNLRRTCHKCASPTTTTPCMGCGMVVYCSPGHRVLDIAHNKDCLEIQRRQNELQKEGDAEGSQYTSRHDLVDYLYTMDTHEALSASLTHAFSVLKNDRADRFSIRDQIPFILLRLGQDQICYDFCVAWTNPTQMQFDPAVTYDFEDPQPFAIPSQDMLDMYEFRFDVENKEAFPHAVAMVLVKVRLLMRVMAAPETRAMNAVKTTVAEHLKTLCNSITGVIPAFWPKVIEEIKWATLTTTLRDDVVFDGLAAQAIRAVVLSLAVWKESPGAVQLLEGLMTDMAPLPGATAGGAIVVEDI